MLCSYRFPKRCIVLPPTIFQELAAYWEDKPLFPAANLV